MKRYLLDTGIMGDFINHRGSVPERVRNARLGGARIGTSIPVVAELFFGIEYSQSRERDLKIMLRALTQIPCWPFTRSAADEFGRIAADLKRHGRPMQQIDIMIAAIALTLGDCTVVSTDSDLRDIPGLSVENWASA